MKIHHGIVVLLHLIDLGRMGLPRVQCGRIKEGTSAVLLQSGLDEKWEADSMECDTYLRNVQDLLADGKTPYERRFREPFVSSVIPFRATVEYHPMSAKDQSSLHQVGKNVLPGTCLGYASFAGNLGKETLWLRQ